MELICLSTLSHQSKLLLLNNFLLNLSAVCIAPKNKLDVFLTMPEQEKAGLISVQSNFGVLQVQE